jgi:hypothetical protein
MSGRNRGLGLQDSLLRRERWNKAAKGLACVAAASALVNCTSTLCGATATSTWIGSTSAAWTTPSNWNTTAYPTNGNGGVSDYNVVIPNVDVSPHFYPEPTLGVGVTIDSLTVNSNAALSFQGASGGQTLDITGNTLANNGLITINSNNSGAAVLNFQTGTLSGSGQVLLNSSGADALLECSTSGGVTSSNTIDGAGELTGAWTNNGIISAAGAQPLDIYANVANNATMQAVASGGLVLGNSTVESVITQTSTGKISANNGLPTAITMVNASISGGTLAVGKSGSGFTVDAGSQTLSNAVVNAPIVINPGATVSITGITNNNSITVSNSLASSGTTLNFGNADNLGGTGTITLSAPGTLAEVTGGIIQASTHTIAGEGTIAANVTNSGIVDASVTGQKLSFQPGLNQTNDGTFEASNGGILVLPSPVTQNSSGAIAGAAGTGAGTVEIGGATISGGSLKTSGGVITTQSGMTTSLTNVTNAGTLTMAAGSTVSITGSLANSGSIAGSGTIIGPVANTGSIVSNMTGQTMSLQGAVTGTGSISIGAGAMLQMAMGTGANTAASLGIGTNGVLDLTNNQLLINYGPGADPIASIATWINSGYGGGTWTGTGITSSTAAAAPGTYGIGYADSADLGNPAGLASGQLKIMYTLLGDANLDGKVNGADFAILAGNFNKSVGAWDQGDFNYDGKANGADFALLAANFNTGLGAATAGDAAALQAFALANGLGVPSVPEPAGIVSTAIAGVGLLGGRRRTLEAKSTRLLA